MENETKQNIYTSGLEHLTLNPPNYIPQNELLGPTWQLLISQDFDCADWQLILSNGSDKLASKAGHCRPTAHLILVDSVGPSPSGDPLQT